ncbi:MAG: S8 family peptidase [Candidatus Limnocylindria bacterium]
MIAVIDSGLRATHEDAGQWKQKKGYDYIRGIEVLPGQSIDSGCDGGHGTHVTTIAAGDTHNGQGIAGAGFNSGILPMRAISGDANNDCKVWNSQTRDWPIRWSRLNGAHIVNMSYKFDGPDPDEESVMAESWANGVTPVTGAANDNTDYNAGGRRYPCAYLYVVCVGANNNSGTRCGNSGFGSSWVDFSAPAQNARGASSASDTSYTYDPCATSYATPLVSGAMALLRSLGHGPQAPVRGDRLYGAEQRLDDLGRAPRGTCPMAVERLHKEVFR